MLASAGGGCLLSTIDNRRTHTHTNTHMQADASQLNMAPEDLERSMAACLRATAGIAGAAAGAADQDRDRDHDDSLARVGDRSLSSSLSSSAPAVRNAFAASAASSFSSSFLSTTQRSGREGREGGGDDEVALLASSLASTGLFSTGGASASMAMSMSASTAGLGAASAAAAAAAAAEGAGAPPRARSVRDVWRERRTAAAAAAAAAAAGAVRGAAGAPDLSLANGDATSIATIAARVHAAAEAAAAAAAARRDGRRGGNTASIVVDGLGLRPQHVRQGCRFLAVGGPQDLRLSDVAALLEEYRAVAGLASDLIALCGGGGGHYEGGR